MHLQCGVSSCPPPPAPGPPAVTWIAMTSLLAGRRSGPCLRPLLSGRQAQGAPFKAAWSLEAPVASVTFGWTAKPSAILPLPSSPACPTAASRTPEPQATGLCALLGKPRATRPAPREPRCEPVGMGVPLTSRRPPPTSERLPLNSGRNPPALPSLSQLKDPRVPLKFPSFREPARSIEADSIRSLLTDVRRP